MDFDRRIKLSLSNFPSPRAAWLTIAVLILVVLAPYAQAATHYVDSAAQGANNGTNWTDAWTSISAASGAGVSAGDTVYISTGTYTNFTPKNGSSGKLITYSIGRDAGHNGTVTFQGSGIWLSNPHHLVLSGDAGDGAMHFALKGYSMILSATSTAAVSYRLSYLNFGTMVNRTDYGRLIECDAGADVEIDHCWTKNGSTSNGDDISILWDSDQPAAAYDSGFRFHHNTVYAPATSGGLGMDGIRFNGPGVSIYNNVFSSYPGSGSQEHQDALQSWQSGSYLKIYNNIFQDWNNASINVSAYFGGYSHVRVYNNLITFLSSLASSGNEGGFVGLAASGFTMTDCIVANNLIAGGAQGWSMNNSGNYSVRWVNSYLVNNISIEGPDANGDTAHGVVAKNNIDDLNAATAKSYFQNYKNVLNGANNDFHLKVSATDLIGQGMNLTSYGITTDFDGKSRPETGPWDIGPYQFSAAAKSAPNAPQNLRTLP